MRTQLKVSVGIKTPVGGLDSGVIRWIQGDAIMLSSSAYLEPGMFCELKLELSGAGGWINTRGRVLKTSKYSKNKETKAILRLDQLSERDQERLDTFVAFQKNQGRPVRRFPRGISISGNRPAPSSCTAIPLRDPLSQLSKEGRQLTVSWHSSRTFGRDWALHLAHGRLPLSCPAPERRAFMLRLILPDGTTATFPAEVSDQNSAGWKARFLLPMAIRAQIQAGADAPGRRVAK